MEARRAPEPALTVGVVARRLGVAPATLRTWDRRYGLGPSRHTAGAHRRYTPADVARLVVMRRLTMEGIPPAEAARIAVTGEGLEGGGTQEGGAQQYASVRPLPRRPVLPPSVPGAALPGPVLAGGGGLASPVPLVGTYPREPVPEVAPGALSVRRHPGRPPGGHGGGRVVALPQASPLARGLARAAMALDSQEMARLLRECLRSQGVVHTWEMLVTPVLTALGQRWRSTGEGVEVEHALTETVLAVLRGTSSTLQTPRNAGPVLLGCPEGDQHSLPLYALCAALAEERIGCRMLGAGLPSSCLLAAVRRSGPSVVFLYAGLPVDDTSVLREIPRQRPQPRVVVGGRGWDPDQLPRCASLVGTLGEAVDVVSAAVGLRDSL